MKITPHVAGNIDVARRIHGDGVGVIVLSRAILHGPFPIPRGIKLHQEDIPPAGAGVAIQVAAGVARHIDVPGGIGDHALAGLLCAGAPLGHPLPVAGGIILRNKHVVCAAQRPGQAAMRPAGDNHVLCRVGSHGIAVIIITLAEGLGPDLHLGLGANAAGAEYQAGHC